MNNGKIVKKQKATGRKRTRSRSVHNRSNCSVFPHGQNGQVELSSSHYTSGHFIISLSARSASVGVPFSESPTIQRVTKYMA